MLPPRSTRTDTLVPYTTLFRSLSYDDVWATDLLAMARGGSTIGEKALMMTTAGYAPETVRLPGFVEHTSRPIQLIDILPTSRTGRGAVPYLEATTPAHAAADIAEGGAYPKPGVAFTARQLHFSPA